ncbi:MAG: ABC transporter permease [Candidatus Woesearchaeota archaeon]
MMLDIFVMAIRNIRKRRMRSWLTMVGIVIGIAAVVSLISLGQGLKDVINEQFVSMGSDKISVQAASPGFSPPGSSAVRPLSKDDLKAVENSRGIDIAVGRLLRPAEISYADEKSYAYIVSMPEETDKARLVIETINTGIEQGRMLKPGDKYSIVVGHDILELFDQEPELGKTIKIGGAPFTLVGILEKKGSFMIDQAVLMMEDAMRNLFDDDETYDVIAAKLDANEDPEKVTENVAKSLRKERNVEEGKEDFTIQTPDQIRESFDNILNIVNAVVIGIAAISLLVGGIGVMNTMYTAVLERTKEIGIMKSIGAKNSNILAMFLMESGMLGMVGGAIGIVFGVGFSKMVEIGAKFGGIELLRANASLSLVLGALAFSFFIGMLSGVLPARQASLQKPVDSLRYE